jgi:hypothetical protein
MSEPSVNLIQDFAQHPEKWATANKEHVANKLGTTVEELEARVAKLVAERPTAASIGKIATEDMPENCLHGRLGEWAKTRMRMFPRSYAWPSLLTAASYRLAPIPGNQTFVNLYTALVGPTYSGKTEAIKHAVYAVGSPDEFQGFGSAEGMLETIGQRQGAPYQLLVDELQAMMNKAGIRSASYYKVLDILFSRSSYFVTVEKRKAITFHARLSLLGCVVEDKFSDCFTAESETGLYSRFLYGLCPSSYTYFYKGEPEDFGPRLLEPDTPFNGDGVAPTAPLAPGLKVPSINRDVFEACEHVAKTEKISTRILEIVTRCARICAAVDGESEVRASGLEPFFALARYQRNVQQKLLPIQGLNHEAIAGELIRNVCNAQRGEWLRMRDICKKTGAYRFSPSACHRAVHGLELSGDLETDFQVPPKGGKKVKVIRAPIEEPTE